MKNKIPDWAFFVLTFLIALGLYWPSMKGLPVWDDSSFWFKDPVITNNFSFFTIWKDFAWPLSVSLQKITYKFWGLNFIYYHLLNLLLHFFNSWLLWKLARKLELPFPKLLYLLFFLHPANVISVSWMIQLKTLLCSVFAILSCLCLIRSLEQKKFIYLSWLFFFCSFYSKSASLPLPVIFIFIVYKHYRPKDYIWLVPFFLMTFWGGYRVLNSPMTAKAVTILEERPLDPMAAPAPIAAETSGQIQPKSKAEPAKTETPKISEAPTPEKTKPSKKQIPWTEKVLDRLNTFLGTTHYYFWQTLLPMKNQPVKGLNYTTPGLVEYTHVVFLLTVFALLWKTNIFYYLLGAHIMLLPFLGIFPAPYMNLTWVSDQHLYLAMPFFICFWLLLITKWKFKYARFLPFLLLPLYCWAINVSARYYKDEIHFFRASLDADVFNVPIAYNLALTYMSHGDLNEAMNVTSTMVQMAEVSSEVRRNKYFPYIFMLDMGLRDIVDKTNAN